MRRRFVRSVAVLGTIGLSSLGADAAAAALTPPAVHAAPQRQADDVAVTVATVVTLPSPGRAVSLATEATEASEATEATEAPDPAVVDLATAAATIGLEPSVLDTALRRPGATLATVAAARGVPAGTLETALVAEASRRLDTAALAGRISPWDVWERRAVLPDVVAAAVQADRSLVV
jgi:lambda repressor-like predicted transcriptional regulator